MLKVEADTEVWSCSHHLPEGDSSLPSCLWQIMMNKDDDHDHAILVTEREHGVHCLCVFSHDNNDVRKQLRGGCTTEKEMVSWWTNKWSQNWQLSWPGPSFTQLIHSNIEMHNVCLQKTPGSKWTLCEICVFRGLHSEKLFWGRKPEKAWVASRRVVPPPNTKKIFLGAKSFRDVNCQRAS